MLSRPFGHELLSRNDYDLLLLSGTLASSRPARYRPCCLSRRMAATLPRHHELRRTQPSQTFVDANSAGGENFVPEAVGQHKLLADISRSALPGPCEKRVVQLNAPLTRYQLEHIVARASRCSASSTLIAQVAPRPFHCAHSFRARADPAGADPKAIHTRIASQDRPFVSPRQHRRMPSELRGIDALRALSGHVKAALLGIHGPKGIFEVANGGTLISLEEWYDGHGYSGDDRRVLQEPSLHHLVGCRRFRSMYSIAATNVNLRAAVRRACFRERPLLRLPASAWMPRYGFPAGKLPLLAATSSILRLRA